MLDVLPLFHDDFRVQLLVTSTDSSPFQGGVRELFAEVGLPPWELQLDGGGLATRGPCRPLAGDGGVRRTVRLVLTPQFAEAVGELEAQGSGGTGVGPVLVGAPGGHTGPNWLFFGEQRQATDFSYREELAAYRASGHLDRLDLAFSRDQRTKVYVQDRMREHGSRLWQWLQDGALPRTPGVSGQLRDVSGAMPFDV